MWLRIKEFFIKYEPKIILVLGFVLVAAISFEAGIIKGREFKKKPIVIENSALASAASQESSSTPQEGQKTASEGQLEAGNTNIPSQTVPTGRQDCTYVGSKNSNKYHLPSCRWAKNIKPENLACFKDKNDAESKGYLPDKNCIK